MKPRLLLVEDNSAIVKLVGDMLGASGYEVQTTCEPDEVLRLVSSAPPQLILMDVNLPGTDGLALTRQVKSGSSVPAPVILAFSANCMKEDLERAREAGCDGFVSKPVAMRELLETVRSYVPLGAGDEAVVQEHEALADMVIRSNLYDLAAMRDLEGRLAAMRASATMPAWAELEALAQLDDPVLREQTAATLAELCPACEEARTMVQRLLDSTVPMEQRLGLATLGFMSEGEGPLVETLTSALMADTDTVAREAAMALGRLARRCPGVADLLLTSEPETAGARLVPAIVLVAEGRPAAVRLLQAAAASPEEATRRALLEALVGADHFPHEGVALAQAALTDVSAPLQALAVSVLSRAARQWPEAVAPLEACAASPQHALHLRAVRALAEVSGACAPAAERLTALLPGLDAAARVSVVMGLGAAMRDDLAAGLDILRQVVTGADSDVVQSGVDVLVEVASSRLDGALEVLHLVLHANLPPVCLLLLGETDAPCGLLAASFYRLWRGEDSEQAAALSQLQETLAEIGEPSSSFLPYQLLQKLSGPPTIEALLASAADVEVVLRDVPRYLVPPLTWLRQWLDRLSAFETVRDPEAQSSIIEQALQELAAWKTELGDRREPLASFFVYLATCWKSLVVQTMFASRRGAHVALEVGDRQIRPGAASRVTLVVRNDGPGSAYSILVEMVPSPDYSIQMGSQEVQMLAAQQRHSVDFVFTPTRPAFDLSFTARYSDFAAIEQVATCKEEVVPGQGAGFTPLPNPYIPGLPLDLGSELFLGREDVFQFLEQNLKGGQKRAIVLVGQRRMGKTSILKQLPLRLPADIVPVFIDGQGLEHQGIGNLLYHMAYIIAHVLSGEHDVTVAVPDLASFQDRPLFTFEYGFIKPVCAALGGRTLLLLIDEFQALDEAVEARQLDPAHFGFLRSLMQHESKLCFLFSGLQKPVEAARDYWQPVFNVALRREVGLLEDDYARQLIEKPVKGLLHYDPAARDELLRLSCGHPYLTQLMCDRLINHLNKVRSNVVRVQHIHEVVPDVFSAGINHFYSLWEDLTAREKVVLIAISATLSRHQFATLSAITRYLRERGITAEMDELTTVLQLLLGHDMITYVNSQPPGYSFRVLLFRLWIEKEMLHALVGAKIRWE